MLQHFEKYHIFFSGSYQITYEEISFLNSTIYFLKYELKQQ